MATTSSNKCAIILKAAVLIVVFASGGGAQTTTNECRPLLMGMMPCAGFLSNPRVYAPDWACCAGFNAMFQPDAITCVCHVVNGDINQILPAPMLRHHARMVRLFASCGHNVPVDRFAGMCRATVVPPMDATPLPLPSPPFPPAPDAPLLPPSPQAPSPP